VAHPASAAIAVASAAGRVPGVSTRISTPRRVGRHEGTRRGDSTSGAVLGGADLGGAVLAGANLTDARLTGASLAGADLSGARLTGADLTGADLTRARLDGAIHGPTTRWPAGFVVTAP
jgi:uncharacterized protein YjbI with pentapeptide repeats